jgi:taurine dioxygenase
MWDNRSVMHQANPDYDMRERRYLYRLLLKGETPSDGLDEQHAKY